MHADAPAADALTTISFVLAKRNGAELEAVLLRVSDPTHAEYGQHLSREALRELIQPEAQTVQQWDAWAAALVAADSSARTEWNTERDILHVHLTVSRMEQMLGHELRLYTHAPSGAQSIRASVSSRTLLSGAAPAMVAAISAELRASVSYIAGVTRFPPQVQALANRRTPAPKTSPLLVVDRTYAIPASALEPAHPSPSSSSSPTPFAAEGSSGGTLSSTVAAVADLHGEEQILSHTLVATDSGEAQLLLIVACTTPVTGGPNWTLPVRTTAGGGFVCVVGGRSYAYSATVITLSTNGGLTNISSVTLPAAKYPLGVLSSSGQAAMVVTVPLGLDYVGWSISVKYVWGSLSAAFAYPFAVKGTARIFPLAVSQLYKVPDALLDKVTDASRAKSRMSVGALNLGSADSQGFFNQQDMETFFDQNRIDVRKDEQANTLTQTMQAQAGTSGRVCDRNSRYLLFLSACVAARGAVGQPYTVNSISYVDGSLPYEELVGGSPDLETTLDLCAAMGGANAYGALSLLHVGGPTATPFEDLLQLALDDPTITVLSLSYGAPEQGALDDSIDSSNTMFQALGASGVSVFVSSGDSGAFLSEAHGGAGCAAFAPAWPASSPWVTSVGGSTLSRDTTSSAECPHEVVCSVEYGAGITGGGGFSALESQAQPSYQLGAVGGWLGSTACPKPSTLPWNATGRAYPDLSLLAHNIKEADKVILYIVKCRTFLHC